MLLKDKIAVIYGAGGAFGGAAALALARQGARVYATGRTKAAVEALVTRIREEGGWAEAAMVDATSEPAIDSHLEAVMQKEGRVDVSFNALGLTDRSVLGARFVDLDAETFNLPVLTYARSFFLTARLAARRMIPQGSGVLLTVSALPAKQASATNGGYGASQAAKEALTRDLSAEFAPHGLRVLCLRPHGIVDTPTMAAVYQSKAASGLSWEQFQGVLAASTHRKRTLQLDEFANAVVLAASDLSSGFGGTVLNLTLGAGPD